MSFLGRLNICSVCNRDVRHCNCYEESPAQEELRDALAAATARVEALREIAAVFAEQEFIADEFGVCWWEEICNWNKPTGKKRRSKVSGKWMYFDIRQEHHDEQCPNVRLKKTLADAAPTAAAASSEEAP